MSNRKDYEQRFILNAQLNGGFNAAFSKAQREFARLGKEIRDLDRVQKDISGYQKQQTAVQNTEKKLRSLTEQQELLKTEMKSASAEALPGLGRKYLELDRRIGDTTAALERQRQKLDASGAKLREAGVDTADLSGKSAELSARLKELKEEQEEAAKGAQTFGEKAASGFSAAGAALAAAGIAAAVNGVKDAFAACVEAAGSFEASMSAVEALSQANAREMAALSAEAKDLGATTKFTAGESADAMGYMAMAGWDAREMLSGMPGVLNLAAASGEDLAMVSDIVTDSLSAFGLTAADTARFADVLAAAATNSNTNVAIMGETFKMSASVAGALGYSVEDVAAAMGLMANSGVKGSIAGTALRNTFNGLLEGVTLTGAAFGEYEYNAVRADGTMKSFGDTIEELRERFDQMTEAERVSNAMAIAGQRGYNGLLAILNAADADYASLTGSINDCAGAAERMAKVRMDNLSGDLTLMNSAWDALKTTIGEQFIPELRGLAEAGTETLSWMDAFVQEHPALVKGVTVFTGALGAAAAGVTGVSAALKLFQALNVASLFTGPVGAVLGGAAAVAAVTGAVAGLVSAVNEGVPSVKELTDAARDMDTSMAEAADAYEETAASVLAAANVADVYIGRLEAMGEYAALSAGKQREYHDILSLLAETVPELADSIDLENNAIEGGTAALRANTEGWRRNALAQAMQDKLTAMYAAQADVLVEAEKNRLKLTEAQTKAGIAEKALYEAQDRMNALMVEAERNGTGLAREYYELQEALPGLRIAYQEAVRPIDAYQKAVEEGNAAAAQAEAEIVRSAEAMDSLTKAAEDQAAVLPELEGAAASAREELALLKAAYDETYEAALDSISGQFRLWEEAAQAVPTSAASVNEALESQARYWREYGANIQTVLDNAGEIQGLRDMLASLDPGDMDTVNFVAGLAAASKKDKKALEDMVSNWRDAKAAQEEAAGRFAEYTNDIAGQMDELQEEIIQDIRNMDFSQEAAESARATIQSYIDAANEMRPQVSGAYAGLWQAAAAALNRRDVMTAAPAPAYIPQYASGTRNAAPGLALVGEKGPELVAFHGGERVLDASQTAGLAAEPLWAAPAPAQASGPISVQFSIQVEGNASPETAESIRGYVESRDFAERVLEVFEEARYEAARRAMR